MDPQALLRIYPWMDHLMAETLLTLHAQGRLAPLLVDPPSPSVPSGGGIAVEKNGTADDHTPPPCAALHPN